MTFGELKYCQGIVWLVVSLWLQPSICFHSISFHNQQNQYNQHLTMTTAITTKKQPIYITIGPPCSGKTTILSTLQQKKKLTRTGTTLTQSELNSESKSKLDSTTTFTTDIHDIALDDQKGVYIPVDCQLFLKPDDALHPQRPWNKKILGKSIQSRIQGTENQELKLILQRCHGILSKTQFQQAIAHLYPADTPTLITNTSTTTPRLATGNNNKKQQLGQSLINAVEQIMSEVHERPSTIDLFIVEALFRPHPRTNRTGIDTAHQQLWHMATTTAQPLSWGNTNTRPREYKVALEVAQASQRQVYFIVYANPGSCRIRNGIFLPPIPFDELLRRNIKRLLTTGKYVPAQAMWDSMERVDRMVMTAVSQLDKATVAVTAAATTIKDDDDDGDTILPVHSKLDLDVALAHMANYDMGPDRRVRYVPPRGKVTSSPKKN